MKGILRSILVASCLVGLSTSLRAQSVQDDAGTVTTDTGQAGSATRLDEVQEPPGEPKGTNVTGAETTTETPVDASEAEKNDGESSASKEEPSGSQK
jgi:hypothetical protein